MVDGYAILQPRTSISLTSTSGSRFTRLFAGEAGIDPYTREVSDVYQDLFGEGSFVGKGIYDVEAFSQALGGRLPENLILSHDLLEGCYARSALVTDVDLIEEHPISYAMDASRRHRWTRGDWQLAGWLLPRVPGPERQATAQPALAALGVEAVRQSAPQPAADGAHGPVSGRLVLGAPGIVWLWPLLVAGVLFGPVVSVRAHRARAQARRTRVAATSGPHGQVHGPAPGARASGR